MLLKIYQAHWALVDFPTSGTGFTSEGSFRSVVVITFASHAKGPRFETGRKQGSISTVLEENHQAVTGNPPVDSLQRDDSKLLHVGDSQAKVKKLVRLAK